LWLSKFTGSGMLQKSNSVVLILTRGLLAVLMAVMASSLWARSVRVVPVNIFGDGNPLNGVEDSRQRVMGEWRDDGNPGDLHMYAGTIVCDRKFRGTAMVVDTREIAPGFDGSVLVSAAHVLYDLKKMKRFKHCTFHFMGWDKVEGYRAKIDLKHVHMGEFDPTQVIGDFAFGEGDWVFLYLPRPWKYFNPDQSLRLRDFTFTQIESYRQNGGEFSLQAFDSSAGLMSESRNCLVVESHNDDLGGGVWKGQLLDDCDSSDGASGGGIIAMLKQQHFLIGIRTGSHWSEQVYPAGKFPLGPPDGSVWNRHSNTNFGRAIDSHLIHELDQYIQTLK